MNDKQAGSKFQGVSPYNRDDFAEISSPQPVGVAVFVCSALPVRSAVCSAVYCLLGFARSQCLVATHLSSPEVSNGLKLAQAAVHMQCHGY